MALVHDWLTGMRGGEKVLDAICELFPAAPLFTFLHVKGSVSPRIESRRITTSLAQRVPMAARLYRHFLPFYPALAEVFNLDDYDLVISSSHCAAKSVIAPRAVHVCYCHSPMRYAWDQFSEYFGPRQVGATGSLALRPVLAAIARWDRATANRPDRFLANSQYVAGRIHRYYNRRSTVVYPPVDTEFYRPATAPRASPTPGFLVVSALVPYKRVDVAIEAARKAGVPLRVVGIGPELTRLQQLGGNSVEFLGWKSDEEVRALYQEATAVVLPGVEDFGMVPVEAQACGTPVVALNQGGAAESVLDGTTGVLVTERSSDALADGLRRALDAKFDPAALRANAMRFSRERFLTEFRSAVEHAMAEKTTAARMSPGGKPAVRENER